MELTCLFTSCRVGAPGDFQPRVVRDPPGSRACAGKIVILRINPVESDVRELMEKN